MWSSLKAGKEIKNLRNKDLRSCLSSKWWTFPLAFQIFGLLHVMPGIHPSLLFFWITFYHLRLLSFSSSLNAWRGNPGLVSLCSYSIMDRFFCIWERDKSSKTSSSINKLHSPFLSNLFIEEHRQMRNVCSPEEFLITRLFYRLMIFSSSNFLL